MRAAEQQAARARVCRPSGVGTGRGTGRGTGLGTCPRAVARVRGQDTYRCPCDCARLMPEAAGVAWKALWVPTRVRRRRLCPRLSARGPRAACGGRLKVAGCHLLEQKSRCFVCRVSDADAPSAGLRSRRRTHRGAGARGPRSWQSCRPVCARWPPHHARCLRSPVWPRGPGSVSRARPQSVAGAA